MLNIINTNYNKIILISDIDYEIEKNNKILRILRIKLFSVFYYWQEMLNFKELDMEEKILNQTYYSYLTEKETFWNKKNI